MARREYVTDKARNLSQPHSDDETVTIRDASRRLLMIDAVATLQWNHRTR